MFFGILVLVVGVVLLLQNLGLLEASVWDIIWPIVVIAFGASLVFKRKGGHDDCWGWCGSWCGHNKDKGKE
jgi:uncharacterized membrane protein HdeD (DUF308 family)